MSLRMPCIETAYRYNFCRLSVCRMTCICPNFIHRLTGNHVYARKHIMVSAFMSYSRSAIPLNIFLFLRIGKNSLMGQFFWKFPRISLSLRNLAYARIPLWRTNCIECHARIPFWAAIFLTWPSTPTCMPAPCTACLPACLLACFACLPALLLVCCACLCSPACLHCLHACLHLPASMSALLPAYQFARLKSGCCTSMLY